MQADKNLGVQKPVDRKGAAKEHFVKTTLKPVTIKNSLDCRKVQIKHPLS